MHFLMITTSQPLSWSHDYSYDKKVQIIFTTEIKTCPKYWQSYQASDTSSSRAHFQSSYQEIPNIMQKYGLEYNNKHFWTQHQQICRICRMMTLTYLVGAGKEWFASMHFDQYAAQTPHVDGEVVRQTKQNLRWSVETTLDVLIDLSDSTVTA